MRCIHVVVVAGLALVGQANGQDPIELRRRSTPDQGHVRHATFKGIPGHSRVDVTFQDRVLEVTSAGEARTERTIQRVVVYDLKGFAAREQDQEYVIALDSERQPADGDKAGQELSRTFGAAVGKRWTMVVDSRGGFGAVDTAEVGEALPPPEPRHLPADPVAVGATWTASHTAGPVRKNYKLTLDSVREVGGARIACVRFVGDLALVDGAQVTSLPGHRRGYAFSQGTIKGSWEIDIATGRELLFEEETKFAFVKTDEEGEEHYQYSSVSVRMADAPLPAPTKAAPPAAPAAAPSQPGRSGGRRR